MRNVIPICLIVISLLSPAFLVTACDQQPEYPYKISLEMAEDILGNPLPIPSFLPEGYEIRDFYVIEETDNSKHIMMLISDDPIKEGVLSSKITLYIALHKKGVVPVKPIGEPLDIGEINGFLVNRETTNDIWWVLPCPNSPGQYEIRLSATKEIPDEELIKIARSISP